MRDIQFLFKTDKEKIIKRLEYYGITSLPFLLSHSGTEKIRGYSGILSVDEIRDLNKETGIELVGFYLFHDYGEDQPLRLSFDAIYTLKDQITKNIIDLDEKQAEEFLKGQDILLTKENQEHYKNTNEQPGFKVIRIKGTDEFIGTGKLSEQRITNYMPKERRLR